jgi:ATPase complex subunit ATP10
MNQDIRLQQRRHILAEVSKGYFSDLNATRTHGGKTWIAPTVLIRQDKALYFPDIAGKSLATGQTTHTSTLCAGCISVVAILSTKISEFHIQGFADATNQRFGRHPAYRFVQINLQENLLKSFLVSLFTSSIRSAVPPHLRPTYLVSGQNMEYNRAPLGMANGRVGYVYLVDADLKIRWGGCADAKPEEARALENCTAVLLNRLEKKLPKEQGAR